uniref:ATP synthase subunit a n=1 Tax=Metacrangonyx remyi TaxID=931576 RepID=K7ZW40_9CRUS|nr:ATP synthase F0 subunit 6 [Metacrangonyx remyi]CCI69563.1 ATP synthase F0 subunit 6 [Metacrangonyx remyi]
MTMNLFTVFDPSTLYFGNNWISTFMWVLFMPFSFWLIMSRLSIVNFFFINYIYMEFKPLLLKTVFLLLTIVSVLLYILFNNILGLFPYIFCASSHMSFTLSLGLLCWVSLMAFGWTNNYKNLLSHLIPSGTPGFLMPFMVLVETISNIIRPLTLSIRLGANMVAGHLLLTLLAGSLINSTLMMFSFLSVGSILLMSLEIAVAFIQAYVFSMLFTLYAAELSS